LNADETIFVRWFGGGFVERSRQRRPGFNAKKGPGREAFNAGAGGANGSSFAAIDAATHGG